MESWDTFFIIINVSPFLQLLVSTVFCTSEGSTPPRPLVEWPSMTWAFTSLLTPSWNRTWTTWWLSSKVSHPPPVADHKHALLGEIWIYLLGTFMFFCRVAVWLHSAEAGAGDHVPGNQWGAGAMAVRYRVWQDHQGEQVVATIASNPHLRMLRSVMGVTAFCFLGQTLSQGSPPMVLGSCYPVGFLFYLLLMSHTDCWYLPPNKGGSSEAG